MRGSEGWCVATWSRGLTKYHTVGWGQASTAGSAWRSGPSGWGRRPVGFYRIWPWCPWHPGGSGGSIRRGRPAGLDQFRPQSLGRDSILLRMGTVLASGWILLLASESVTPLGPIRPWWGRLGNDSRRRSHFRELCKVAYLRHIVHRPFGGDRGGRSGGEIDRHVEHLLI